MPSRPGVTSGRWQQLELGTFSVVAFWHERQAHDPAHAWLRGVLQDVCRTV